MPNLGLTYVDALPRRATSGKQSKFSQVLDELRQNGNAARITVEPYETEKQAEAAAARIRSGLVIGAEPGEFDAVHDPDGHVYAQYAGEANVKMWAERREARRAAKKASDNGAAPENGTTSQGAVSQSEAPAWQ